MKISQRTLTILQNYSTINQSILLTPGNVLKTISPQRTILASATIEEEFDREFAIYDLSRFLSVLSLFNDPDVIINDKFITLNGAKQSVNYMGAVPSMIVTPPTKPLQFPDSNVTITLEKDELKSLLKAASVLQMPEIAIVADGNTIKMCTFNSENKSSAGVASDMYSIDVGETDKSFQILYKVEKIKLLPSDYTIELSFKGVSKFIGADVEYIIAPESSSKYT